MTLPQQLLKFIIVGDSGVGKTCIMSRFIDGHSQESSDQMIGVEFGTLLVKGKEKLLKLQIWNSERQAALPPTQKSHYKGAAAIMLVFDLTRRETFNHLKRWLDDVRRHESSNVAVVVIGNKCDLAHKRAVSYEEAQEFAQEHGLSFFECCAKTSQNIEEAFVCTALKISDTCENKALEATSKFKSYMTCSVSNENIHQDSSPPRFKVGWDLSLGPHEGGFKTVTNRRQRGLSGQTAPDRSKHALEDETQEIPSLEDGEKASIATPPRVISQRVPSYKELDTNTSYMLPFIYDGDIDLRPLISALTPTSHVFEEDILWEPSSLLSEMTFKLNENKGVLKNGL